MEPPSEPSESSPAPTATIDWRTPLVLSGELQLRNEPPLPIEERLARALRLFESIIEHSSIVAATSPTGNISLRSSQEERLRSTAAQLMQLDKRLELLLATNIDNDEVAFDLWQLKYRLDDCLSWYERVFAQADTDDTDDTDDDAPPAQASPSAAPSISASPSLTEQPSPKHLDVESFIARYPPPTRVAPLPPISTSLMPEVPRSALSQSIIASATTTTTTTTATTTTTTPSAATGSPVGVTWFFYKPRGGSPSPSSSPSSPSSAWTSASPSSSSSSSLATPKRGSSNLSNLLAQAISISSSTSNPSSKRSSANEESLELEECSICECEPALTELPCKHRFCLECMRETIRVRVMQGDVLGITCPWVIGGKACQRELLPSFIRRVVSNTSVLEQYNQLLYLTSIRTNSNLRYCVVPTCSAPIYDADGTSAKIQCRKCGHEMCFFCTRDWHERSCAENEKRLARKNKELREFLKWKKNARTKPCPRCLSEIEKNEGCNHMTCVACGYQWCWLCREEYSHEHYSRGPCAGMQFQDPTSTVTKGLTFMRTIMSLLRPKSRDRSPHARREINHEYRFCMLGSSGVGKSPLVTRYISDRYVDEYDPTIEDSFRKQITFEGQPILLNILDTSGMEEMRALQDQWIRESNIFLVCYDIFSAQSFEEAARLLDYLFDFNGGYVIGVLVGTKLDEDKTRHVSFIDAEALAATYNIPHIETSAKTGENVPEAFLLGVRALHAALAR